MFFGYSLKEILALPLKEEIGTRFIVGLPIRIFVIPFMLVSFIFPFMMENANTREVENILPIYFLIMFGSMCFIIPISLVMAPSSLRLK
jgi:hypothetical protein